MRKLAAGCGARWATMLALCAFAVAQSKPSYEVLAPEIVLQGEEFSIRILQNADAGQTPIPLGTPIVINGNSLQSEEGGKIRVPAFLNEIGNQFLTIIVGNNQATDPQHVEVVVPPQPPGELPPRTWHISETTSASGNLRVDGQGLGAIRNAGLRGSTGNHPLDDSVGSSLQQIYRCPPDLPKGAYLFVAEDASGKKLEALNTTTNPTLTITGDQARRRGQRGKFVVTSDVEGDVQLSGGEPIIRIDAGEVHLTPNQAATIGFTALQVGNYDVHVKMTTPDWPLPAAPRVDANVGRLETHFNPGQNQTTVNAPIKVTDARGQPVVDTPVDVALTAPSGIQCSRVNTDKNGQANFQASLPGQVSPDALKLHCFRVRGHLWNKQPPPQQQNKREQKQQYEYAVKFVCGDPVAPVVAPGRYFTAINVHNPGQLPVLFRKKVAVALPGERVGPVSQFYEARLMSNEALEIDCPDILEHAHQAGFLKGFVVIESPMELDVVAVYSAGHPNVETLDIDRVHPRLISPAVVLSPPEQ